MSLGPGAFISEPDCTNCSLHEGTRRRCIGCRPLLVRDKGSAPQALYILGEAPGDQEERAGQCFVGVSGKILTDWLRPCNFKDQVDVYAANVIRCRLPGQSKPTAKQYKACQTYIDLDLDALRSVYGSRITVLVLGASASRAILDLPLKGAFKCQGDTASIGGHDYPVYATYHPAYTLSGRSPTAVHAVADHLDLLCRRLSGAEPSTSYGEVGFDMAPPPPKTFPALVSLDIETYGISEEFPPQTVFHPTRSICTDHIRPEDLVQTVALAWLDSATRSAVPKAGVFLWQNPDHREILFRWLRRIHHAGAWSLGMNFPFDLSYLRASPQLPPALLDHTFRIEDLAVWNYLVSDVRPEKSLKAIAPLVGVARYGVESTRGFRRYPSAEDPEALAYNALDAVATLNARNAIRWQIKTAYPETAKLSDRTRGWYSDLLWLCVCLSESGVSLDRKALLQQGKKLALEDRRLRALARQRDYPLAGPGSQGAIQELVWQALTEANLLQHPELERTDKGGQPSTGQSNLWLLLQHLDSASSRAPALASLRRHRKISKIITTYLRPLTGLGGFKEKKGQPDRTQRLIRGVAYPTWFPVPMELEAGQVPLEGGTRQARITAKRPALQTGPEIIKKARATRFNPGFHLAIDLSQIELVIAGFLAGDEEWLAEYKIGLDRHTLRAVEFFGPDIVDHPDFREVYRFVGKIGNFLIIYRGGPFQLRATLREEIGFELPLPRCREIVALARARYPHFQAWQDDLILQVSRDGYWADPILGQGRLFTRSFTVNRTDYESTICNCPVQLTAANLLLSAQMEAAGILRGSGCKTLSTMNVYDSMEFEGPLDEQQITFETAESALAHCAYRRWLEEHYERTIPFKWETKTLIRR